MCLILHFSCVNRMEFQICVFRINLKSWITFRTMVRIGLKGYRPSRSQAYKTGLVSSMIHSARPTVSPVVNIVFAFEKWGRTDETYMYKRTTSAKTMTVGRPRGSIFQTLLGRLTTWQGHKQWRLKEQTDQEKGRIIGKLFVKLFLTL